MGRGSHPSMHLIHDRVNYDLKLITSPHPKPCWCGYALHGFRKRNPCDTIVYMQCVQRWSAADCGLDRFGVLTVHVHFVIACCWLHSIPTAPCLASASIIWASRTSNIIFCISRLRPQILSATLHSSNRKSHSSFPMSLRMQSSSVRSSNFLEILISNVALLKILVTISVSTKFHLASMHDNLCSL